MGLVFMALVGCGGGDDAAGTGGSGGAAAGGGSGGSAAGSGGGGAPSGGAPSGGSGGAPIQCNGEPTHTGEATYYDFADGSGNCGFPATPNDLMVGAMNATDYAGSAVCGTCAHLTGPSGEVTARIVDQCPECKQGDIDLSPSAFAKIAAVELGRVDISWQYVPCTVSGPIRYFFKEGSNQWWTAVQIRNHLNAIAKLEYDAGGGNFVAVNRESYNYFVADQGMGPGPYSFRVTDVYGSVLTDTGIAHVEAGEVPGAAQFPVCGAN